MVLIYLFKNFDQKCVILDCLFLDTLVATEKCLFVFLFFSHAGT